MENKELEKLWERYLETRSHGELDIVIEELIKRTSRVRKR